MAGKKKNKRVAKAQTEEALRELTALVRSDGLDPKDVIKKRPCVLKCMLASCERHCVRSEICFDLLEVNFYFFFILFFD